MKKNHNTIDLFKFAFALCIVAIHTELLDINASIAEWLCVSMIFRLAVPFFFVVSGYFLGEKILLSREMKNSNDATDTIIHTYCYKLVPPLLVWGGGRALVGLFKRLAEGCNYKSIFLYIFQTICYPMNAMWFLSAAIIGALIIGKIYRCFNQWRRWLIVFGMCGYVIVLICNNYYFCAISVPFVRQTIDRYLYFFVSARNGVFLAPLYMGIGFILGNSNILSRIRKRRIWLYIITVGSYVTLFIEAMILYDKEGIDDRGYFISYIILIPCMVCVMILNNIKINLPYKTLRRLSTSIYFIHRTVIAVLQESINAIYGYELFILTVIVCMAISLISYRCKLKWLHCVLG